MRKTFALLSLATATLSLTSCFKSWTCECTYFDNYASMNTSGTISGESLGFKSKLKKECEAKNYHDTSGGYLRTQTCVLK